MKRITVFALCALAAAALVPPPAGAQNSSALLSRLVALSSSVRSYTAQVHADIAMRTFPYLTPQLDGTYYHKEPSKDKLVFTSGVPLIASAFNKIYPHVESPSRWQDVYAIVNEGNDGRTTSFKLVPRHKARIDHIDARVDDRTAELLQLRWVYTDGGYATLDQTYGNVDGHELVTRQSGHVQVPNYTADVTSSFSNFKLDADIPDSIFAGE